MNLISKAELSRNASRGLFIASGAVGPVEIASVCGFEWLILDMEHGLGDENMTLQQIRALDGSGTVPLVRIPLLDAGMIKRFLDFGAAGIMCPMISNSEQAGALVSAMRYPPEGMRGLTGSSRASSYGAGFKDYFRDANGKLLCIAQIETAEAVENVDSIAAVPGIDVLFIGHSDLSLNLGCYNDFENGKMHSAEKVLLEACARHGKIPGMLMKSGMRADDCIQKGFRFLALGTDHSAMKQAFLSMLQNS